MSHGSLLARNKIKRVVAVQADMARYLEGKQPHSNVDNRSGDADVIVLHAE